MLGKLMKHECKATSRLMAPLLLVVLGLGLVVRVYDGILKNADSSWIIERLHGLLIFAFVIALIAAVVCAVVLMVQRFSKNLMGDEGYLMFTLPVSDHALIFSKLLVSVIWFLAVIAVDLLAVLIAVYETGMMHDIADIFAATWRALQNYYLAARGWVVVELVLLLLVSLALSCLQFYAPIAIGHSFAKRKGLLSVVFFFVLQFIQQIIATGLLVKLIEKVFFWNVTEPYTALQVGGHSQWIILWTLGCEVILAGILYLITWLMMKKRLNLA